MKKEVVLFLDGKEVYRANEPLKVYFFDTAIDYGQNEQKLAKEKAEVAWELYLKDDNPTPVGELADYLANMSEKEFKRFKKMSRYEQLSEFYSGVN